MTRAFTLLTAMPPTKGHLHLMEFVAQLGDEPGRVIVCTQPHEPFPRERYEAVALAGQRLGLQVVWIKKEMPQDPCTKGFWPIWDSLMDWHGFRPGDIFVSSEMYGQQLADRNDGIFIPYDPGRELHNIKASRIREEHGLKRYFNEIMPEFQHNLRTTVTIFGAESTGKTTLSRELAAMGGYHWIFEWARPYLTNVGIEITVPKMEAIWAGQKAVQKSSNFWYDKPAIIQDTDLFSTVGYWEQPHWAAHLGEVPPGLIKDAQALKSDLYIITRANIPYEQDGLRYGDNERESSDEFWFGIADKYNLNYIVLDSDKEIERLSESMWAVRKEVEKKQELIAYDRKGL